MDNMKSFLHKSKAIAITLLIVNMLFAGAASAKTTTWNLATGGLWTTAGNWNNGLPVAGDDVIINGASTAITSVPTISLASLTITGTCNLTGNGTTITITGAFSVSAGITFSLGTNGNSTPRVNLTLTSTSVNSILGTVIMNTGLTDVVFSNSGELSLGTDAFISNGAGGDCNFTLGATGILKAASTTGISTTAGTGNIRVTGTRTYTAGSEVIYNGTAAQVTGNAIPTASHITIDNASGVTLTAAYTGTGRLTMTNGTLNMANVNLSVGALTGSGNLTHASGTAGARTLSVTGSTSPAAYTGEISNGTATSVSLIKSGTGTLILEGLNTYTGTTTISAGTISINSLQNVSGGASSLGAPTTAGNGTIILVAASSELLYTGTGHSSNRIIQTETDGSTIDASGSGALTLTGGVISNGGGNDDLVLTGTGTGNMNSVINTAGGVLSKTGSGTWVFGAANTYTGTTTISAGTIQYGINNAINTGAVEVSGGTLNIGTFSDAVGTVTLSNNGIITGTTGVLTGSSYAMQSGTASAILGGTGALTKTTGGTVTLSGVNTYTGVTSINAGILSVATIGNGGVAGNIGAATAAAGNLVLGGGTLEYTGASASTNRAYTLTTGTTSTIDVVAGANTLTLGAASANTNGALTKTGVGTLLLSAANLYTGLTTVSEGSLLYGINSALSNGPVTVNGGIYDIATFTDAVGTVTLVNGTIAGTTGVLTGTSYAMQNGNASAILAGGVTLTKTTGGTVTLSGTNTYSGLTTISAGTLIAANTQALGTVAGAVNLGAAILDLQTDASVLAYNFTVSGNGTIISNRATPGAGITHTLGTLSIGNFILSETVGANVNSGTAALSFGTTTLSAATPRFDVATGAVLTLGALVNNNAFTKQGNGLLILNTASARTSGTVTLSAGSLRLGIANALGTAGVAMVLNGGELDLASNTSVNAHPVTVGGDATIITNRATAGAGITHTLGTLSIGLFQLNSNYGSNVTPATKAGLTFGTTTLSGAGAGRIFQVANDVDLTLGALVNNNPFTKQGDGLMILNTASTRTGGTVTINTGSVRLGSASALGTSAVPVVMNAGSGLNLAINTTVNAYPVTINGNAIIVSNRSTAGAGITHTLGTLSIGNSTLTVLFGDNVNDAAAGLTFGATTFTASTAVFDAFSGGITITLGALSGNFAFNKAGGGRLNLNTASARTGGTATLLDGTMSLGAVNAIGTIAVPLQINGGTLDLATATTVNAYNTTVGGDATILSNKNAAGAGITHVLGTLSIGAYLLNINQGDNVNSGTAAIQFGNFTMTGAPTLSPNTANLLMAGTATGAFKLTKAGAGTLQKTTTAWTLGSDFEITAGTFDATTQNTTILGNWINNGGTHTATGASTVNFNGSTAQTIGGSAATTFNNLIIDNAAGVALGNNETVNAVLTMTNGNLTIPTGNTLTVESGSAIAGSGFGLSKNIIAQVNYSTGAKGFLRVNNMAASAAYLFPVGDGINYLPVTLTPTDVQANNSFSVCSFEGLTVNGEPNGTPFTVPQKNNTVDAVWTVNYNGPGSPTAAAADMTVAWPESLEGINFTGYGGIIIGIAHYGPSWGAAIGTGDNSANTATRTGITQFSPFGVGKIEPAGGTLAIKIIYFNGSKGNNVNNLYWKAECTSSFAKFDLERSTDGVNFTSITVVTATQARCELPFSYNDYMAPAGNVYYRIRIIDADGKVTYSAIVKLGSAVKEIELAGFMPNPVAGNAAQLKINTTKADVVNLVVIALDGKILQRTTVQLQPGSSIINMDMTTLPAGAYLLKGIFSDGESNAIKFIKQ
jgi:fibronectin-binding autotransporter adhesin